MHVSSNRLWHKSQREKTFRECVAAHCVYEGCVLFLKQLSLLTSVNLSALCPGVFQDHYHVFVVPLCFLINYYSSFLNPPNNPPAPTHLQVCRLYSGDAEADPGADAGRSLTVLYLVHTNLSEQSHSPSCHSRWVQSSITVKVTLCTYMQSSRETMIQTRAKIYSIGGSFSAFNNRTVWSVLWICRRPVHRCVFRLKAPSCTLLFKIILMVHWLVIVRMLPLSFPPRAPLLVSAVSRAQAPYLM